ncbi:aromatic ring-hydroxylating dioxygenase subunit alpha [Laspinema palackyanum]|uniref:aromatic ring-hydroxylating dioxygenase subunit alpha n=1 Tax=Laspinema palackyanum TaxID=3231601 RepID=UPI00345C98D9|nr:aromatic ring-hydroxylating dioxygenase subunit alpha [Laspinema sp. D2c]
MNIDPILTNDWHPVAAVRDLPEKTITPVRLLGEELLLWQSGDRIMAWQDICPHRGARLSQGKVCGDTLVCPYHGLAYNPEGQCVLIPAYSTPKPPPNMRVKAYACVERYGLVWVNLGEPETALSSDKIPPFLEWEDANFRKFLCGPFRYQSSGLRAMENFIDVSHFPFVHDGFLGDANHTEVSNYEVTTDAEGISLNNLKVWQPDPDGTGVGGEVTYNYRIWRPLTASFAKAAQGGKLGLFFTITPLEEEMCLGWMWIAMNYGQDIPEEDLRQFQETVVQQDIPIVESQRPKRLPLDLAAEVHLACDQSAIAYRKWLKRLGVTYGTV